MSKTLDQLGHHIFKYSGHELPMDCDFHAPTKADLGGLLLRAQRSGVIAFGELNCPEVAGETSALLEYHNLGELDVRRPPFNPNISRCVRA